MGHTVVPIVDIIEHMGEFKRVFDSEVFDLLEASPGYQPEEEFTFTFRLSLDLDTEKGQKEREWLTKRLRSLDLDGAEQLIELLEENDWDVSFFADFF